MFTFFLAEREERTSLLRIFRKSQNGLLHSYYNHFKAITMCDLLLSTLEMMGLTFAIGFFVAFVIKLIAGAADSLEFYSSHQKELLRLRRLKKLRQKVEQLMWETPPGAEEYCNDQRGDYSRGIDRDSCDTRGYYHGVSLGASKNNLVDYYYPEDIHTMFLRNAEEVKKNQNKDRSNKQGKQEKKEKE